MGGRRKTDFDFVRAGESVDWDIVVDKDAGYQGMEGRVSMRRRYFTIGLQHVLYLGASVAAGLVGGAFIVGVLVGAAS